MADLADFLPGANPVAKGQLCVLFGPVRSGKSKLLFQLAVNHAKAGREVLFVTSRPRMEVAAETLSCSLLERTSLKRIQMKYIETEEDLTRFVANCHLILPSPQVFIVDNFSSYFLLDEVEEPCGTFRKGEREGMCALFHTMALIQEMHQRALESNRPTLIMVACTTPVPSLHPRLQHLFARHRASFFVLQSVPCPEYADSSWCYELTKIVPLSAVPPSSLLVHHARRPFLLQ